MIWVCPDCGVIVWIIGWGWTKGWEIGWTVEIGCTFVKGWIVDDPLENWLEENWEELDDEEDEAGKEIDDNGCTYKSWLFKNWLFDVDEDVEEEDDWVDEIEEALWEASVFVATQAFCNSSYPI